MFKRSLPRPFSVRTPLRARRPLRVEPLEERRLLSCSTPNTQSVRGKDATFDQCFNLEFEHEGTDFEVSVYYTETTTAADLTECDASENAAGRALDALTGGAPCATSAP